MLSVDLFFNSPEKGQLCLPAIVYQHLVVVLEETGLPIRFVATGARTELPENK
jgi:hypothetical protein